jgi:ZIP family zinc transporter
VSGNIIIIGFLGSLAAGLATVVGAIPILTIGRPNERQENIMLGFAAGVMLAASFFSLIIPGLAKAQEQEAGRGGAAAILVAAILLGALTIGQLNRIVPPLDRLGLGPAGMADAAFHRRIWLFVAAITLHNFPEGLAVGVSFGTGDLASGTTTALGIGLQNVPEGLAVAAALATLGYSRWSAVLGALISGLVEPVGGLLGVTIVSLSAPLLPWGLGFAAGAMIYVVASEIIPQTQRGHGSAGPASAGLMVGLAAMMFLDVTLS